MIAKNEEPTIYESLVSSLSLVDEYIIGVDTLSSDNTKSEALRFAGSIQNQCVVYDQVWKNDFSKARNDCMKRATGDWIFILDAHEFFISGRDKVLRYLNDPGSFEVFMVELHNSQKGMKTAFFQDRFFKNIPEYRYQNACHNIIVCEAEKTAKLADVIIQHKRGEALISERKEQRSTMNIADILKRIERGDRRALAQLPQEYISMKEYGKAAEALEGYLHCDMSDPERYQVYLKLAMAYYYNKNLQEVTRCLSLAGEFNADKRNAHFVFLGEFFYMIGNNEVATTYFKKALRIPKPRDFWFLYPKFYHEIPRKYLRQINDNDNVKSYGKAQAQPNV